MGFVNSEGRWANTVPVVLAASSEVGGSGETDAFELGDRGTLCLTMAVEVVVGSTPTLDVAIETSEDAATWRSLGSFTQATAEGSERKSFSGCDRFVRLAAVVDALFALTAVTASGTTPPTVTVSGEPSDPALSFEIDITTGGARGTAAFKWSSDGGSTWTEDVATAATVLLGDTGVTAHFATGTDYTDDNVYTWTATGTAPVFTVTVSGDAK